MIRKIFTLLVIMAVSNGCVEAGDKKASVLDGSIVAITGGHRAVRAYTHSPYSHVGIIINENDVPYVYEADHDIGVRKISLKSYIAIANRSKETLWLMQPKKPLAKRHANAMRRYLISQIGREYTIWSYIRGKALRGCHCSELVTNALRRAQIYITNNPCKVSPGNVVFRLEGTRYTQLVQLSTFSHPKASSISERTQVLRRNAVVRFVRFSRSIRPIASRCWKGYLDKAPLFRQRFYDYVQAVPARYSFRIPPSI